MILMQHSQETTLQDFKVQFMIGKSYTIDYVLDTQRTSNIVPLWMKDLLSKSSPFAPGLVYSDVEMDNTKLDGKPGPEGPQSIRWRMRRRQRFLHSLNSA